MYFVCSRKNIFHLWALLGNFNLFSFYACLSVCFYIAILKFLIGLQLLHISLAYLLFCTYVQCYETDALNHVSMINSQQFIYACICFQFSSACLFPFVHLQMWNYFELFLFFFSQKMYHYHYFIFSLLQYLNMTLKPRNKLTWHHCNFAYYYRRNGEWHLNKPWMWQLSKIMR